MPNNHESLLRSAMLLADIGVRSPQDQHNDDGPECQNQELAMKVYDDEAARGDHPCEIKIEDVHDVQEALV